MMRGCLALLGILAASSADAADGPMRWVAVHHVGIDAELPEFVASGPARSLLVKGEDTGTSYEPVDRPIMVRIYRVPLKRPMAFLDALFGSQQITYRVDKSGLGVVSGLRNRDVFYAMCRTGAAALRCIDIVYPASQKPLYDAITERIAKSFRR